MSSIILLQTYYDNAIYYYCIDRGVTIVKDVDYTLAHDGSYPNKTHISTWNITSINQPEPEELRQTIDQVFENSRPFVLPITRIVNRIPQLSDTEIDTLFSDGLFEPGGIVWSTTSLNFITNRTGTRENL